MVTAASAQEAWPPGDLAADEIARHRLDHHPRASPVDLHPRDRPGSRFDLRGVLAYGALRQFDCDDDAQLTALDGNHLALRLTETLDRGWTAHVHLEHGLDGPSRCDTVQTEPPGHRPLVRGSTVGLGFRGRWYVDLGRQAHPAAEVLSLGDPLDGRETAATGLIYPRPHDVVPSDGTRTSGAARLRWVDPAARWSAVLQLSDPLPSAAPESDAAGRSNGVAVTWRSDVWTLAGAWQRWRDAAGSWTVPLMATRWVGQDQAHALVSVGQVDGQRHRAVLLGWQHVRPHGPWPARWLFTVGVRWPDAASSTQQWAVAIDKPLSNRTTLTASTGIRRTGSESVTGLELGMRHAF